MTRPRGQQHPVDSDWIALLQWCLPHLGYRWAGFRKVRNQVIKRLKRRLAQLQLATPADYRRYLAQHPDEWPLVDAHLSITISRFWRDRAVFNSLTRQVLPRLCRQAAHHDSVIRAWSLGCCSGEEPYSLLLAWELGIPKAQRGGLTLDILASDRNPHVLQRAQVGLYPRNSLRELPECWISKAFVATDDGYQLQAGYRQRVTFVCQDLRQPLAGGPFDLILCRNLLYTYFAPTQQQQLQAQLLRQLKPGGFLVVGCHEQPVDSSRAGLVRFAPAIYQLASVNKG